MTILWPLPYSRADLGADMVEVDVRESRDGYIVVILDATVDRTTNGRRCVKDMSLRELRKR